MYAQCQLPCYLVLRGGGGRWCHHEKLGGANLSHCLIKVDRWDDGSDKKDIQVYNGDRCRSNTGKSIYNLL